MTLALISAVFFCLLHLYTQVIICFCQFFFCIIFYLPLLASTNTLNSCPPAWIIVTASYLSPNFKEQLSQHHFVIGHLLLLFIKSNCFVVLTWRRFTSDPCSLANFVSVTSQPSFLVQLHAMSMLCSHPLPVFSSHLDFPITGGFFRTLLQRAFLDGPMPALLQSAKICWVPTRCQELCFQRVTLLPHGLLMFKYAFCIFFFLLVCYILFICLFSSPLVLLGTFWDMLTARDIICIQTAKMYLLTELWCFL